MCIATSCLIIFIQHRRDEIFNVDVCVKVGICSQAFSVFEISLKPPGLYIESKFVTVLLDVFGSIFIVFHGELDEMKLERNRTKVLITQ